MTRPLSGSDAATKLQTIFTSAHDHAKGTLFVSQNQVAHRSGWGRFFKRNPVSNTESLREFENLLKQAYPAHHQTIEALLQSAHHKRRLTTGTVQRVAQEVAKLAKVDQGKYVFIYPPEARTDAQKLRFEDEYALNELQKPETIRTVCDFALRLADHLEKSEKFSDPYAEHHLNAHIDDAPLYPVHQAVSQIPKTKAGLIGYLRSTARSDEPDRQVALLSIMWKLSLGWAGTERLPAAERINDIYKLKVKPGKQHESIDGADVTTVAGTLGNTRIPSEPMSRFEPHQKERESVRLIAQPNERVAKFLRAGNPYISGSSGMANAGSALFPLLGISMRSTEGKVYGQALAAFIVAAGEHSYPEVYKSLNLSLRYVEGGVALPSQPAPEQA